MAFPAPLLVAVTDTNALAARACHAAAREVLEDLFVGLAGTGRSHVYVSAHVPGELADHLADVVAGRRGLALADAEAVLWGQIMPRVPVVDLAVRDYLHPRVRPLMDDDPTLPRRLRGDIDDIGTAALAEFLAPAVIISADSVFTRFGLAGTIATDWLPTAYQWLNAAGFEATLTDTAMLLEVAVRAVVLAAGSAARMARRHPLPAVAVLAGAAYLAGRGGYLNGSRWRTHARRFAEVTRPWQDRLYEAFQDHQRAREALVIIEPYGPPTTEQAAARHLARIGRRLTPAELHAALIREGYPLEDGELHRAVAEHPAFIADTEGAYRIGRPSDFLPDVVRQTTAR